MRVVNKSIIQIKSGREKVGVNILGIGKMKQNEDGLIFFKEKNPVYFDLIDYSFDGPVFEAESKTSHKGKSKTKIEKKTKKKGKTGRVLGGALVGSLLGPPGLIVGAAAGASGKSKSKSDGATVTNDDLITIETHKQIEKPSSANLQMKNRETGELFVMQIVCDSKLHSKLLNFAVLEKNNIELHDFSKSNLELIKEYKELLDLGIITPEEFELKKTELLNLN